MALTFWGGSTGTGKVVRETSPTLVTPTIGTILLTDGVTAPDAAEGFAKLYVDVADGDLKIEFGDDFGAVVQADS